MIQRIVVGAYGVNCYIVNCNETKKAAVIDPGGDAVKIINYLNDNELDLEFIILTHAHGDHIAAIPELMKVKNVPVYIHESDSYMLEDSKRNLSQLISGVCVELKPDRLLIDGETIELGTLSLEIIHTPGHSKGSISIRVGDLVFTGDTLFSNSIGRTDLDGGSFDQIITSIKERILSLSDNIHIYPGHGSSSTIGKERTTNPFLIK